MKHLLILAFLFTGLGLSAQSNNEEIELYQAIFGMEKKEVTASLISLSDENSEKFWSLYDEYETKRKDIGMKRVKLIKKYAEMYGDLNEENITPLVKEAMKVREANNKLIKSYHKKISKEVSPMAAAQFYQLEHYFLSEINVALYTNIPMVGELKAR